MKNPYTNKEESFVDEAFVYSLVMIFGLSEREIREKLHASQIHSWDRFNELVYGNAQALAF